MRVELDRSPELGLVLVAAATGRDPQYQTLEQAPAQRLDIAPAYLRQMHAVANGVIEGLVVRPRMPWDPRQWERARAALEKMGATSAPSGEGRNARCYSGACGSVFGP